MANTSVKVINQITKYGEKPEKGKWSLAFQYCKYNYANGTSEYGYRFIWYTPEGKLQPARGQARIPSTSDILYLVSQAIKGGWGHFDCDKKAPNNSN